MAILVVLLVGAALPVVYFFVVEPGITKTEYEARLVRGPDTDDASRYHWFGIFDEYSTRRPFRDRVAEPMQLVVMLIAISDAPEGARFSSGGGSRYSADGDGSDFRYDLHIDGYANEELGMNDDWSKPPRVLEEFNIEGSGDRKHVVIGGKPYDLAQGRVFLSDRRRNIHQLAWQPIDGTPQAIDKQVNDLIRGMGYLP
jgi:hypothetical protein